VLPYNGTTMRGKPQHNRPRRPSGGGGSKTRSAPAGPHARRYGRPPPKGERGPKACPMCGELVTNLSQHVRSKHDDANSHPRD
jgi:hypothetical protein